MKAGAGGWGVRLFAGVVLAFLIAPILIVFPLAFSSGRYLEFPPPGYSLRWFENFFTTPTWTSATITSMSVAIGATILATVTGTAAAFAIVRGDRRVAGWLATLSLLPLIIPVIVLAVGLYYVYAQLQLIGSVPGLVLAHALLGLPFVVINVGARLRGFDVALEMAARGLGAPPLRAFWTVTLPQILPGVLAGAFFAFLASWDEIVVALFLAGTAAVTLPVQMFRGIRFEVDPTNSAVAALLVSAVFIGAALFVILSRKRN